MAKNPAPAATPDAPDASAPSATPPKVARPRVARTGERPRAATRAVPKSPAGSLRAPARSPSAARDEGNGRSTHAVEAGRTVVERISGPIASALAHDLDLRQGVIGRVDAEEVAVSQGAIGSVHGDRVSVEFGAVGAALGGETRISQAAVGAVVARSVHLEQTVVRTVIAQDVTIRRPSAIVFLLAQRVQGEVRVLFDWRAALALGAALAVIGRLLRRR